MLAVKHVCGSCAGGRMQLRTLRRAKHVARAAAVGCGAGQGSQVGCVASAAGGWS